MKIKDQSAVLFSEEDKDLRKFTWNLGSRGFVRCRSVGTLLFAHREVCRRVNGHAPKAGTGMVIDHINRDRMDNRRENLRVVSLSVSAQNRTFGQMRGVEKLPSGRFRARVNHNGKQINLAVFDTVQEASACALAKRQQLGFIEP